MLYPIIGIPLMGKGIFWRYMQYPYTHCLRRAGASIQILPWQTTPESISAAVNQCAGFLFPGGPDIRPALYGQSSHPGCGISNPVRDDYEISLLRAAIEAQKPLLCIGRGMQLLNIAFGGTLRQDLKSQQEYPHSDFLHRAYATHPIEIDLDSLLGQLFMTDTMTVNSLHHQAADTIGEGLWIAADSPEGFPEALQIEDYPFCLAIQWHPEHMAFHTPIQQRLFQSFVDHCRKGTVQK